MKRLRRWMTGLLILMAAVFFLPYLMDLSSVKSLIEKEIGETADASIALKDVKWSWFPLPNITTGEVRFTNKAGAAVIKYIEIYPDFSECMKGTVKIGKVTIGSPDITLTSIDELEKLLTRKKKKTQEFQKFAFMVKNGRISVPLNGPLAGLAGKEQPPVLTDITADIESRPEKMSIRVFLNGSCFKELKTDITIDRRVNNEMVWDFSASTGHVDLDPVRNILSSLFPENKTVHLVCADIIRGGKAISTGYTFKGTEPEWADLNRMVITAEVENAKVHIPGTTLIPERVAGKIRIEKSILYGQDLSAALGMGKTTGRNIGLVLGLSKEDRRFTLDADIRADLADVPPILREFVKNQGFISELDGIQSVKGTADVRLVLGDNLKHVNVGVTAKHISGSSVVRQIGRNVVIHDGEFSYRPEALAWTGIAGTVGPNQIKALRGSLTLAHPMVLDIQSMDARIDSSDIRQYLGTLKEVGKTINKAVTQVSGFVDLTNITLRGPLVKPVDIRFQADASTGNFTVQSPHIPWTVKSVSGKVHAAFDREPFSFSWTGLSGDLGPHQIRAASGSLSLDRSSMFDFRAGAARVDSSDVRQYVRTLKTVEKTVSKVLSGISGRVDLQNITIKGSLENLSELRYEADAVLGRMSLQSPLIPFPLESVSGKAHVSNERISFPTVAVLIGGKPLDLAGELDKTPEGIWNSTVLLKGTLPSELGPFLKEKKWIPESVFPRLPCELMPLTISVKNKTTTVTGAVAHWNNEKGVVKTQLDLSVSPKRVDIRRISIEEGRHKAVISTTLPNGGDVVNTLPINFKGSLDRRTVSAVIEKGDQMTADIAGDFHLEYPLDKASAFSLKGPLTLKRVILGLNGQGTLSLQRATLSGEKKHAGFIVKNLEFLRREQSKGRGPDHLLFPKGSGDVTFLPNNGAKLTIASGNVCGLSFAGDVLLPEMTMDLRMKTEDDGFVPLEDLCACFGFTETDMTGDLNLSATVKGRPDMIQKGSFRIWAKDGVVKRAVLLTKILSLVDLSELFSANPLKNLLSSGYRYESMDIEGTITGHNIHITHAMIIGAGINFYATGYIDLETMTLDMVVLASPFKMVDSVVNHIPVIGKFLGGRNKSILSLPIVVEGNISDPNTRILPKPISAVSSGVINLFVDTFKMPFVFSYNLINPDKKDDKEKKK